MTRILIARHGNTFDRGDIVTRVGARTDLALSTSGQIQAAKLSEALRPDVSDFYFTQAFCSPLERTRETAEAILGGGHQARLSELEFLTEIDYGIDENRPETAVIARLGEAAIRQWDDDATVPDGWQVNPKALIESWKAFFAEQSRRQGDILVVTSNGIARFALDAIDRLDGTPQRKLRTAAYGIVSLKHGLSHLECWNRRPDE